MIVLYYKTIVEKEAMMYHQPLRIEVLLCFKFQGDHHFACGQGGKKYFK
jgi:hypothetical protein